MVGFSQKRKQKLNEKFVDFSIIHQKANIMFISHFKIHKSNGPEYNITNKQTNKHNKLRAKLFFFVFPKIDSI